MAANWKRFLAHVKKDADRNGIVAYIVSGSSDGTDAQTVMLAPNTDLGRRALAECLASVEEFVSQIKGAK